MEGLSGYDGEKGDSGAPGPVGNPGPSGLPGAKGDDTQNTRFQRSMLSSFVLFVT